MRLSGIPVAVVAGAAAALLGAVPAGAGDAPTITVTPASGPIGTKVTISGDSCHGGHVTTGILRPPKDATGYRLPIEIFVFDVDEDGEWSVETVIPATAPLPTGESEPLVPSPDYQVSGLCSYEVGDDRDGFQYDILAFELTPGDGPTPTTSVPSTTPTTTFPGTTTPPPAKPISDDPPFTG